MLHSDIDVPMLGNDNFMIWKERVLLQLGLRNMDYAILKDKPVAISAASTPYEVDLHVHKDSHFGWHPQFY